jgi:glycosyltransferase involved in cell wall biosynthesis
MKVQEKEGGRKHFKLSIVIPCFNEERTLERCVDQVRKLADKHLELEIIIVDDGSDDQSPAIGRMLDEAYPEVVFRQHEFNRGKGAALRTGFGEATGDYVAVQDADLEYDPQDLKRLLIPLIKGEADVVLGSRFLGTGPHRVLYFWHYLGNRILTLLSNLLSDLNLTDMETCYKVFRREVIQSIQIQEDRFGFEPEIVAKVAHRRLRIFEDGITYRGRTYEEGKKIGAKDGIWAFYCIIRYNAHHAPWPIQFMIYLFIGGLAAILNLTAFLILLNLGWGVSISALTAFYLAAFFNYLICILSLFRHKARWNTLSEFLIFLMVISAVGLIDLFLTNGLIGLGISPALSKLGATMCDLSLNFSGRRFLVFPEAVSGPWRPLEDLRNAESKKLPDSDDAGESAYAKKVFSED